MPRAWLQCKGKESLAKQVLSDMSATDLLSQPTVQLRLAGTPVTLQRSVHYFANAGEQFPAARALWAAAGLEQLGADLAAAGN